MADPLTINLIDKVRQAAAAEVAADTEFASAKAAAVTAQSKLFAAQRKHRDLQTELKMAVEERHPSQELGRS